MGQPEPTDAAGLVVRGVARLRAGEPAGVDDLATAARLDPELADVMARFDLALAWAATGREPALVFRVVHDLARVYHARAGALLKAWDFAAALAASDVAVAIEPGVWQFRLTRAHVLYHLRSPGAQADYGTAYALDPAAVARAVVDNLDEAVRYNPRAALRDCENHLRDNPADVVSLARRGLIRLLQGQDAEAEADFAAYRRLSPDGVGRLAHYVAAVRRLRRKPASFYSHPTGGS